MSQYCNFAVVLKVCHVFWEDFRSPVSEADTRRLLQTLMEGQGAPSASDASIAWPSPLLHATDRVRDAE